MIQLLAAAGVGVGARGWNVGDFSSRYGKLAVLLVGVGWGCLCGLRSFCGA